MASAPRGTPTPSWSGWRWDTTASQTNWSATLPVKPRKARPTAIGRITLEAFGMPTRLTEAKEGPTSIRRRPWIMMATTSAIQVRVRERRGAAKLKKKFGGKLTTVPTSRVKAVHVRIQAPKLLKLQSSSSSDSEQPAPRTNQTVRYTRTKARLRMLYNTV